MRVKHIIGLALGVVLSAALARAESTQEQGRVLDSFHAAAAAADLQGYLSLLSPEIVFLGTDASERWQGQEFRDFVTSSFSAGRGWNYATVERRISISPDAGTAWFDETLHNDALGQCRGSGVMVRTPAGWKIAQYNLALPIPNAMVQQVVADIAVYEGQPAPAAALAAQPAAQPVPVAEPTPSEVEDTAKAETTSNCRRKRHKTNRKAGC